MKSFSDLYLDLDSTNSTVEKVNFLSQYFQSASDTDKVWAVALLSGRKPKRPVKVSLLHEWAAEAARYPLWLFEESYHTVGDLAETIALFLPPPNPNSQNKTLTEWMLWLKSVSERRDEEKKTLIMWAWSELNFSERFIFNKLITGGYRVGVSRNLIIKALSKYSGLSEGHIAHRLMGDWTPDNLTFKDLLGESQDSDPSKPYPFFLAYPLEKIEDLGEVDLWQAERKWDGIRGQIIKRGKLFVWSRGEELITDQFPEFKALEHILPEGTVLDGEILPYSEGKVLSFQLLQTRIGRLKPGKESLKKAPVVFVAYDIMEFDHQDIRDWPLQKRREKLNQIVADANLACIKISEVVLAQSWEQLAVERANSRYLNCEGLMLKRFDSPYRSGRKRGDWWKWKIDPLTVDAVMVYAQAGHGRRANLFTDFTFAVWNAANELITFTKAYSGLSDEEMKMVDQFVKKNTLEKFGPVRVVKPELVFEIGFEGIALSKRHKSGIALRFPRILRTRFDKNIYQANTLQDLMAFLDK
jgi:DNA ligase-1